MSKTDERAHLQALYEQLLEMTDPLVHDQDTVDVEAILDVCRRLTSGRGALIHQLDAQIATLTEENIKLKAFALNAVCEEFSSTWEDGCLDIRIRLARPQPR